MNSDILSLLGISIDVEAFAGQQVDRDRPLYFGITSDVVTGYNYYAILLGLNLAFVVILDGVYRCFSRKDNIVCKYIKEVKDNLLSSQIINILIPIALPWSFVLLQKGVINFRSKINKAIFLFLFFVVIVFPIYFFF